MNDAADYVVWSNEHGCWWGPERCGYQWKIEYAGRYTRDEAMSICRGARGGREFNSNPTEVPLLLADAQDFWGDDREEWEKKRNQRRREKAAAQEREMQALMNLI